MLGFGTLGEHALGELIDASPPPLYYSPVSRIYSGGTISKPAEIPTLTNAWNWDTGAVISWDDSTIMETS